MKSTKPNTLLKLVDYDNNSKRVTVLEILRDAISDIEGNPDWNSFDKCLILFLDNSDSGYHTAYKVSGLDRSEIIALCEVVKTLFTRGLIGDGAL